MIRELVSQIRLGTRLWFVVALALLVAVVGGVVFFRYSFRRGNIVLIVVDTLRADALGCYGGRNATPNLDRLASCGMRLDPVVGSFHQTTASMGAMFTGMTPSLESDDGTVLPWNGENWCGQARFVTGASASRCLSENTPTLGERLKRRGYHTVAAVGNSFLFRPAGFDRGFEEWREVGSQEAKAETEALAVYARRMAASRSGALVVAAAMDALKTPFSGPVFLYVHFMDAHDWWTPGDSSHSLRHTRNYGVAVEKLDRQVGDLLEKLRESGILEGATVVLVADHGESLGEIHPIPGQPSHQGNPTYEPVSRIPLLVCRMDGEGNAPATFGRDFAGGHQLIRTQDLFGLILALGGDEDSFPATVLQGDEVYYSELEFRTLRSGHWKITCPRSGSRGCALFDLAKDPAETTDLASSLPEQAQTLVVRMDALARQLVRSAKFPGADGMSDEDRRRLQALGYLQ